MGREEHHVEVKSRHQLGRVSSIVDCDDMAERPKVAGERGAGNGIAIDHQNCRDHALHVCMRRSAVGTLPPELD